MNKFKLLKTAQLTFLSILTLLFSVWGVSFLTTSAFASDESHVHSMTNATCLEPAKCETCTHTEGYALTHDWVDSEIDGKKECTRCSALFFPDFEYVTKNYATIAETGFNAKEILNLFPSVVETKYENGKYMIKDIGAFQVEFFTYIDYQPYDMTLENGYWTVELSQEYYDEVIEKNENFRVNFLGKNRIWQILYINGRIDGDIQIATTGNTHVILIKTSSDFVEFLYPVYDRHNRDSYSRGTRKAQEVTVYIGDFDFIITSYSADGSFVSASVYLSSHGTYFYYVSGFGWAILPDADPEYACDAPAGYESVNDDYFTTLAPTTINCTHEEYIDATCQNPERCKICGIDKEGSQKVDHDMSEANCDEPSTCKFGCGYTEGSPLGHDWQADVDDWDVWCSAQYTCTKCFEVVGENVKHEWEDATCTSPSYCTICENTKDDDYGHEYDNGCDTTCNAYGEDRTTNNHADENADDKCDECGAELQSDGINSDPTNNGGADLTEDGLGSGAIAGIAVGSTAVAGLGGFSLFWFVIKKKKLSDLFIK